jgi:hypothetical protein
VCGIAHTSTGFQRPRRHQAAIATPYRAVVPAIVHQAAVAPRPRNSASG